MGEGAKKGIYVSSVSFYVRGSRQSHRFCKYTILYFFPKVFYYIKVRQPPPWGQPEFKMADKTVAVRHLGRLPYGKAMTIMKDIVTKKLASVGTKSTCEPLDTLLLVEHNPVYTIGTRSHVYVGPSSEELGNIDVRLKRLGAEFHIANRGGLITFHGPGQLVCYPILNLRHYRPSVKWYINNLEEVIIKTCNEFSLNVGRTNDIGVWIDERKIAAIGNFHISLLLK